MRNIFNWVLCVLVTQLEEIALGLKGLSSTVMVCQCNGFSVRVAHRWNHAKVSVILHQKPWFYLYVNQCLKEVKSTSNYEK